MLPGRIPGPGLGPPRSDRTQWPARRRFCHNPRVPPELTLQPIGFIRSGKQVKFQAGHQPSDADPGDSILELVGSVEPSLALRDLEGFERIWLIWWFHRNEGWRPLVLPPRGPAQRRGVFATRCPYRPNPLGLTPVTLLGIEGRHLRIGPCDLVDGTPVFDIKPYIPDYDAFPSSSAGWHDVVEASFAEPPRFTVVLEPLAQTQAAWLQEHWSIDFRPRMIELLSRDPHPHRSRRIRRRGGIRWEIGCGAWRAFFEVEHQTVRVFGLDAAYAPRFLENPALEDIPDRSAQRAFRELWPLLD